MSLAELGNDMHVKGRKTLDKVKDTLWMLCQSRSMKHHVVAY